MIMNRRLVYFIRTNMPENQWLHDQISKLKLRQLRKKLIPDSYIKKAETDASLIPYIVCEFEQKRPRQTTELKKIYENYLQKAEIRYSAEEFYENQIQMLFNCLAYGFSPDEYEYYRLKERTPEDKKTYVTDLMRYELQYIMSDFKDLLYLFDKFVTYEKFCKYFKRDVICVENNSDFEQFVEFAKTHNDLVIKQVNSSCGKGVWIEKSEKEHLQQQFDSILRRGKCVIEERITQPDILKKFNETSINTVRITTFNTKNGIVIGPSFLRTGRNGSVVDNGGSGGIFIGIDRKTGILNSNGWDEYLHQYIEHPDSGIKFLGFQLPEWNKCVSLAKELAAQIPKVGYVGWDLVYSSNGWILVEGNAAGQFLSQIVYECGCKSEIDQYIADRNISF